MNEEEKISEYKSMIKIMQELSKLNPDNEYYKKLSTISFEEYNSISNDELNAIALHQSYKDKIIDIND